VTRSHRRDEFRTFLKEHGVGTQIHYPIPVHRQKAYTDLGWREGTLPHTEKAAREILSLPLYPELTDAEDDEVTATVLAWTNS